MTNSVDPDRILKKPTDLDLHCLQNRVYPGSAGKVKPGPAGPRYAMHLQTV